MTGTHKNDRFTELDGLRGIAALLIVIYHYTYNYNRIWGYEIDIPHFFAYGSWGVPLFFIISGFVIFWSILRQKKPATFALSRFRRLYPPFWVALVISIPVVMLWGPENLRANTDTSTLLMQFTMMQEYFGFRNFDGVFWTLTLELSFYFIILNLAYFKQIEALDYWLIFWLLSTSVITLFNLNIPFWLTKLLIIKYNLFFAMGIAFYKIRQNIAGKSTYTLVALCILTAPLYNDAKATVACYLLFSLFWLTTINKLKILSHPVLLFFGTISYSLYLIHQNLGYTIIGKLLEHGIHPAVCIIIATTVSISLAYLMHKFIEQPSGKLFRRKNG